MTSFEDIKAKASLAETTVPIVLGGQFLEQIRQLEAELAKAGAPQSLADAGPRLLAEQIEALRAEMAGTAVEFRLRAMPGREWNALKFAQPVKGKDEDEPTFLARFFDWTTQMVAATCVDPMMTSEQVAELVDLMPGSSWDQLSDAAWGINAGRVNVPFSAAASAWIRDSDAESRRPSSSESPTADGSAKSPPKSPRMSTTKVA